MPGARGAYGFRLEGVEAAHPLLVPTGRGWPTLDIRTRLGFETCSSDWIGPDGARLRLPSGGRVDVDRRGSALFTLRRRPSAQQLVHPCLGPVAAVASSWLGRESFHAGAVLLGDGAWAVTGPEGSGKSSLLAWLAMAGFPVLTDQVLVVDHELLALAGPRSIELPEGAAGQLGVPPPVGSRRDREGYRMVVGEVPAAVPLCGFIKLAWGDVAAITRVPSAWRPVELSSHRAVPLVPEDPKLMAGLTALPMYEFRRPRDWEAAGLSAGRLLETLTG